MSQEYYAVEKETNLGALNIGLNVFQSIAVKTVESIDVTIRLNKNNQVIVDIAILIDYGLNVTTITNTLQNKIAQSCFEMTGIKNIKVNIEVKGINF